MTAAGGTEFGSFDTTIRRLRELDELAKRLNVPQQNPFLDLSRPAFPASISEQENTRVNDAVLEIRSDQYDTKKSQKLLRSDPRKKGLDASTISDKEATTVLAKFLADGCSAGEALKLINLGADVNYVRYKTESFIKRVAGKDLEDVRSDGFTNAVKSGNALLVNVLANDADAENINDSLKIALQQRYVEITEILMLRGADPNICGSEFMAAIRINDVEIISILLSGTVSINALLATASLHEMARRGNVDILRMLLASGADANTQTPSALEHAVDKGDRVSVAALCMADKFPSPDHLARCVSKIVAKVIYQVPLTIGAAELDLMEVLLAAGANGPELSSALMEAASGEQHQIVDLLTTYCSEFHTQSLQKSLQSAIRWGSMEIFQAVLSVVNDPNIVDEALVGLQALETREAVDLQIRTAMSFKLISRGVSNPILSHVLCEVSKAQEMKIIDYLVEAGASIDYANGRALKIAVQARSIPLLRSLLNGKVSNLKSFEGAVQSLHDLPLELKYRMTEQLLKAGATGPAVDALLENTVAGCDRSTRSYELIEILLQAGAAVDVGPSGCLFSAIHASDIVAFDLLQPSISNGSNLEDAFSALSKVSDLDCRYSMMQSLLQRGARGVFVAKALVDILERMPRERRFSRLLVQKGAPDINLFEGKAASLAVQHRDVELLRSLTQLQPSIPTLNKALRKAMTLEGDEVRTVICEILLEAGAEGVEVDDALIRATVLLPCDMDLVRLFLRFGASIDYKSGSVLHIALANLDLGLLDLLVQQPAQLDTIRQAWNQAISFEDEEQKIKACQSLLKAKTQQSPQDLGAYLRTMLQKPGETRLFHILLEHGACVNIKPLEAFHYSIASNDEEIMQALLGAKPNASTVQEVFEHAWRARERNGLGILDCILREEVHRRSISLDEYLILAIKEESRSSEIVAFLTTRGASAFFSNSKSLQLAASALDVVIIESLLTSVDPVRRDFIDFEACLRVLAMWIKPGGPECFKKFLEFCESKEVINSTLVYASAEYQNLANAGQMVDLLVKKGADLDFGGGRALQIAAEEANSMLISQLLDAPGSQSSISKAFPHIVRHASSAGHALEMIRIFSVKASGLLDVNADHEELQPVLFLCIDRTDRSVTLMDALVQLGAQVNVTVKDKLYDHTETETLSVLLRTVSRPPSETDFAISQYLIAQGADVNFVSSKTHTTPILAASSCGNFDTVTKLIAAGASTKVKTSTGTSPLVLAATNGNVQLVNMFLKAGVPRDDGSLHAAAAARHNTIVSSLLNTGHNPNLPSPLHRQRAALEVALSAKTNSSNDNDEDEGRLQYLLELLHSNGANPKYCRDGKSLLIMALDQDNAIQVVPALLKAFMGELINEDFNVFVQNSVVYSPTSYLIHNKHTSRASKRKKQQLITLLKSWGCGEMFYHETGPQPKDFRGAPRYLVEQESEYQQGLRKQAEEGIQHQLFLKRLQEQAEKRIQVAQHEFEANQRRLTAQQVAQESAAWGAHEAEMQRIKAKNALIRKLQEEQTSMNKDHEASLLKQNRIRLDGLKEQHAAEKAGYKEHRKHLEYVNAMVNVKKDY